MYLARFESPTTTWLQGLVHIPCARIKNLQAQQEWWNLFHRLQRNITALPQSMQALRLLFAGPRQQKSLHVTLSITIPEAQGDALRRYLTSFTRLDRLVVDSVVFPSSRAEFDAIVESFPPHQCHLLMPAFTAGGAWFVCDFQVAPLLNDLLAEASALEYTFGYQLHLHPFVTLPEHLREAKRNLLRMRNLPSVSPLILEQQERCVQRLQTASVLQEEFLGVETPEAARWLRSTLQQQFRRRYGHLKFETPDFAFAERSCEDLLTAATHRCLFAALDIDELCSAALDEPARTALFGWRPDAAVLAQLALSKEPDAAEPDAPGVPPSLLPAPYEGQGPYCFISYKRQDAPRIAPILQRLAQWGYHFWYDKGIPGGSEWDTLIEDKVHHCQFVLLFVSNAAVNSKYVRREVKCGDTLDKPLLSIKLEDTDLGHGMKMLLTQYQMLDARQPSFFQDLEKAVAYLGPSAKTAPSPQ